MSTKESGSVGGFEIEVWVHVGYVPKCKQTIYRSVGAFLTLFQHLDLLPGGKKPRVTVCFSLSSLLISGSSCDIGNKFLVFLLRCQKKSAVSPSRHRHPY